MKTRGRGGSRDGPARVSFQLVVSGSGGVGKSACTLQFCTKRFVEAYDPTIQDSHTRQWVVDERAVLLTLVDTAGQEELRLVNDGVFRSAHGFLLVYDITSKASLDEIPVFLRQILRATETDSARDLPIVLVGNKVDLTEDRQVSTEQGKATAKELGISGFVEITARDSDQVEGAFRNLVRQTIKKTGGSGRSGSSGSGDRPSRLLRRCSIM